MAIKLVTFFAVLFVVAHAAVAVKTVTTVTTTVVSDDETRPSHGGQMSQQCQQEFQRRDLAPCVRFLFKQQQEQQGQQHHGGGEVRPEEIRAEMGQCCSELKKITRKECICECLGEELREALRSEREREDIKQAVLRTAQNLPQMCGRRVSECRFSSMSTPFLIESVAA